MDAREELRYLVTARRVLERLVRFSQDFPKSPRVQLGVKMANCVIGESGTGVHAGATLPGEVPEQDENNDRRPLPQYSLGLGLRRITVRVCNGRGRLFH